MNKGSAIAGMAAQCYKIRIFAVKLVPLFHASFLSYLWEYRHISYITEN